jgi:hypothetical protein
MMLSFELGYALVLNYYFNGCGVFSIVCVHVCLHPQVVGYKLRELEAMEKGVSLD